MTPPALRLVPIGRSGSPDDASVEVDGAARDACAATADLYRGGGFEMPWIGYLAVEGDRAVGACAFKAPPRDDAVEIAYFTFPGFEGRGRATAMARELVAAAHAAAPGLAIRAQTLPATNASTRILEKLCFTWMGAVEHPEDGTVWEWRLEPGTRSARREAPPASHAPSHAPHGKSLKYARVERERRFLLAAVPDGAVTRTARIADAYIAGTRLRLRRSLESAGEIHETFHKLTQKIPGPDGTQGSITTIYLSPAEYEVFAALPARALTKTRSSIPPYAVDVFDPPLDGLVIAEVEFDSEQGSQAFPTPPFAVAEVTRDLRFTGARLAATTREELLRLLGEFGVGVGEEE